MKVKEVVKIIAEIIPPEQAEEYDNVGLLCGNTERNVSGILICHDALEKTIDEAILKNINFIISFHPIIFNGLKKITGSTYVEKAILKAIENKIAIYVVHTALDNDYFGVNFKICETLNLKNQKILQPKPDNLLQLQVYVPQDFTERVKESLFTAGAGNIGFYDECSFKVAGEGTFRPAEGSNPFSGTKGVRENAKEDIISVIFESYKSSEILKALKSSHPYEEIAHQIIKLENTNHYSGLGRYGEFDHEMDAEAFLHLVKDKFNLKLIRHSSIFTKKIKKVGVLGGSGASGIAAALRNNCDAYLTGDLKYHDFFSVEDKMLLCDIGHFESEQFVVQQIFEKLSQKFTTFAVLKSEENTNPVNYFL